MFIKHWLACLACLFFVAACSNENQRNQQPIRVDLKGGGDCLSNFGTRVSDYTDGKMNDAEIGVFWDCVGKAINDYEILTHGDQSAGSYTPQAIRRFLQRYFIKNRQLDDPLLNSIMEVKRVLLSGTAESITREELQRLQEFIALMKELSVQLNPHVKVAFMSADSASDEEVIAAGAAFENSLDRLGQWLAARGQEYTFTQMLAFVERLETWMKANGENPDLFEKLRKGFDVLPASKRILIAGSERSIAPQEWPSVMKALGQGYMPFLAVKYAFKKDLNSALVRGVLPLGLDRAGELLERGASAHPQGEIPLSEFRELFEQMSKAGWLDEDYSVDAVMNAFTWALRRPLAVQDGVARETLADEPSAVTAGHLRVLRENMSTWTMLYNYAAGQGQLQGELGAKFDMVIKASRAAEWDNEGRLTYPTNAKAGWTRESLTRMVWPFVVINMLKEAYVGRAADHMNEEQMVTATSEIVPMLQQFGWLKTTKPTVGKKLLREADVFTAASNGNLVIEMPEGVRYLAYVGSAFRAAQLWLEQVEKSCPGKEAKCVRAHGSDLNKDILTPLPRLKAFLRGKPKGKFAAYTIAAEETILDRQVEGEYGTADMLQVWMIFQYIENFVQRFDTDSSELISLNESKPAYGVFGPTLEKLLSNLGLPPEELDAFFTFLLKYGDTPFTMFGGQIYWNHWRWHRNDWVLQSDRDKLMGILNQLSKL